MKLETIAQRLDYLVRTVFKMTPEEFSAHVGVNSMTIRNIIKGKAHPSFSTIEGVLTYTKEQYPNFNPNWFTLGEGEPFTGKEARLSHFMAYMLDDSSRVKILKSVQHRLLEMNMLKSEFAEAVGYSNSRVSNILNDKLKTTPRASFLHKMLDVIQLSEEELLQRAGLDPSQSPEISHNPKPEERLEKPTVRMRAIKPAEEATPDALSEQVEELRSELAKKDLMIDSLLYMMKKLRGGGLSAVL